MIRVLLGEYLPPRALVVHRVLQAVPVFVIGGGRARPLVPRAPVLTQVLKNVHVPIFGCGNARVQAPRAPVLVQVLESGQVPICDCVVARVCTPITVVLSRPLQQLYTPLHSSVGAYGVRSFTKKSNDSLVGQRQCFVVVHHVYATSKMRFRERAPVELARVRSGRLGGVPPQLAHQGEAVAGLDALHVGEHHSRDIQVRIEGRTVRIERLYAVPELHGDGAGRRVRRRGSSWSWLLLFREKGK